MVHINTKDVYEDNVNVSEERFDTSNYWTERALLKDKNEKVIRLVKDELDRKIMTEFPINRPKTYSYLIDNDRL